MEDSLPSVLAKPESDVGSLLDSTSPSKTGVWPASTHVPQSVSSSFEESQPYEKIMTNWKREENGSTKKQHIFANLSKLSNRGTDSNCDAKEEEHFKEEFEMKDEDEEEERENDKSSCGIPEWERFEGVQDAKDRNGRDCGKSLSLYSGVRDIIGSTRPNPDEPLKTGGMGFLGTSVAGVTAGHISKSISGGLLVHRPIAPKKNKLMVAISHLSDDLQLAYRMLSELMSDYQKGCNAPYMEAIELDIEKNKDYLEVIKKPIWLKKIKDDLLDGKYQTITELVGDLRLMLENAYRYYGPVSSISKKGLRLEHMMEQKIALMPKEVRDLCSLEKTSGQAPEDITQTHRNKTAKISVNGDNFFSYVLYRVRGCRIAREKELKRRRMEAMRQAKKDKELEIIQWERDLLKEPIGSHMRAMWELPQIGHFIYLTLQTLNIYEVPQYELERMLLMPEASRTLAMLMTSLLSSPQQRQKLGEKPYMPYTVWARKLAHKTMLWYRCYSRESKDKQKVFDLIGIEPQFWLICGERNPFEQQLFHEMTFHQRVWLVKSLCDFLLHNHKSVQEVMTEQPEQDQREYLLGSDRDGNQYLHFPQFCGQDLRIYRRAPFVPPDITVEEPEEKRNVFLPPEKVKEYKKMMRKLKKRLAEDAAWEGSRGRKKKRGRKGDLSRRGKQPDSIGNRSRPENLRQRPRARYNDVFDALELSSDEEDRIPLKRCRKIVIQDSESEEELSTKEISPTKEEVASIDEVQKEMDEDVSKEISDERTPENSVAEHCQGEDPNRASLKNPRRGGKKKRPACELCGKTFQNVAALKGHRAVHTKEKQKLKNMKDRGTGASKGLDQNNCEQRTEYESEVYSESTNVNNDSDNSAEIGADGLANTGKTYSKTECKADKVKSESLVNGNVKDEPVEDAKFQSEVCERLKAEEDFKMETMSIKSEVSDGSDECNRKLELNNIKSELDSMESRRNSVSEGKDIKEEILKDEKVESPASPQAIHDPSPYLPNTEDFQLMVSSVDGLRELIKKFGDLPCDKEKEEVEEDTEGNTKDEEEKIVPKKVKSPKVKKKKEIQVILYLSLLIA